MQMPGRRLAASAFARLRLPTARQAGGVGAAGARLVELAAVIVAALAAAKLIGSIVWPLPQASIAPPRTAPAAAPIVIANPFGDSIAAAAPTQVTETAVETSLNLTLFGTWVERNGGTATIGTPEGKQKVFSIGQEICCGARLERVFADYVLIDRNGAAETLRLANKTGDGAPAALAASAPVAQSDSGALGFSGLIAIRPAQTADGKLQLLVAAARDVSALGEIGLAENDVIVSINGRDAPSSALEIPAFLESLRGVSQFEMVVRRNGVNRPLSFALPQSGQEG